jgi:hypothetical protein
MQPRALPALYSPTQLAKQQPDAAAAVGEVFMNNSLLPCIAHWETESNLKLFIHTLVVVVIITILLRRSDIGPAPTAHCRHAKLLLMWRLLRLQPALIILWLLLLLHVVRNFSHRQLDGLYRN